MPRSIRAALGGLLLVSSLLATDVATAGQALQPGAEPRFDVAALFNQPGKVKLDRQFRRQLVRFDSDEKPGTIVVVTGKKFLYLVLGDG